MNCEILETLYLRANGDIPCNDDAGENVLLGLTRPKSTGWSATSFFQNHRYRQIRDALRHGQAPWPEVCEHCAFFRPNQPFSDELAHRRIRKIQVEASLACGLRCPGCSNKYQVRVRPGPLHLDVALFTRVLRSLRDEGYTVGQIEYCGQGEPLEHPQFAELSRLAREHLPSTHQRLITNGNSDFTAVLAGTRLDEIMVSCDGVFPESYARYRVGGSVERPFLFMCDARTSRFPPPVVIWKYILFEWNDSDEELLAAQNLADEMGLDALLFVYTHSAGKSRRYTLANPLDLPVRSSRVITNATPYHYRHVRSYEDQPLPAVR